MASFSIGDSARAYNRKAKSLSVLCSNFIRLYNQEDVGTICLDDAARRLCVVKRRIYDVVNILESLGVLLKKGRNQYSWIGFTAIPKTLEYLKAFKNGQSTYSESEKGIVDLNASNIDNASRGAMPALDQRRENVIGTLTKDFVKLLLNTDGATISLVEIASKLFGDAQCSTNVKEKSGRLYDIGNILSSLNLIEKVKINGNQRKTAFRWLGLEGRQNSKTPPVAAPLAKQSEKRSFGTEITNHVAVKSPFANDRKARDAVLPVEQHLAPKKRLLGTYLTTKEAQLFKPPKKRLYYREITAIPAPDLAEGKTVIQQQVPCQSVRFHFVPSKSVAAIRERIFRRAWLQLSGGGATTMN